MLSTRIFLNANYLKLRNFQKLFLYFVVSLLIASSKVYSDDSIQWVGCGITKNAFTKTLATAFKEKTSTPVFVRGGGALKGIRDAASGRADIGGTCRLALDFPEEKNAQLHHVAWDALVLMVPKQNPINNLSSKEVHGIINGNIKNWKQLGGNDQAIEFYSRRGALSGVGHMFRVMFFKQPGIQYQNAIDVPRSSGLVEMLVGKGEGTIGISGASSAQKRIGIKMLSLDGIYPSKENIQNGTYYLIRPLYYATNLNPNQKTQQFIDFALSHEGQTIISQQNVVNLEEGKQLLKLFKDRFGEEHLAPALQ